MFEAELILTVLALSILAGLASYLQGSREGKFKSTSVVLNLAGEITSAVVAGMTILFLGTWQEYPESLTCLCSLLAASQGKDWTALLGKALADKLNVSSK